MKSNKEYRFKDNPKEQEFHDKFKEMFDISSTTRNSLSGIIFGWKDASQNYPHQYLTKNEEDICLNLIQWLGSPVGQGFLDSCGFIPKNNMNNETQKPQYDKSAVMRMIAVSFAKWLRDNTVADGAPKLLLRVNMKRYTIEELYDLYTLIAI